jgi:hypothetical protein
MKIETVESGVNDDGVATLTVTGRSIELWLDDRAAMPALAGLTATPNWTLTGTPGTIARKIFNDICVTGVINVADRIPFYHSGTLFPAGNIEEPSETITISLEPDSVYNSIKKICDIYHLGFRLVRNNDMSQIYFDVYTGDNRTSAQALKSAVIFNPQLDNLDNTSELTSTAQFKNVAYVFGANGTAVVTADFVDETVEGKDRRVLLVNASDIDLAAGSALTAALEQRGREALAEHRLVIAFDGEIPQFGSYTYGIDYGLGDLVEKQNVDGVTTNMRVTEQIFVSDAEGDRSYPTLAIDTLITPGTWLSWTSNEVWDDVDPELDWNEA